MYYQQDISTAFEIHRPFLQQEGQDSSLCNSHHQHLDISNITIMNVFCHREINQKYLASIQGKPYITEYSFQTLLLWQDRTKACMWLEQIRTGMFLFVEVLGNQIKILNKKDKDSEPFNRSSDDISLDSVWHDKW